MKIAILGSSGFIGNHLTCFLSKNFDVVPLNRKNLDLYDFKRITEFLSQNKFDYIINSAASYTEDHLLTDTRNNLSIFMNFYNNSDKFGKFIHLGSGAEFDRKFNIDNIKEIEIFNKLPDDSYGYSHNIMSRLCYEKENFMTLRIFGCFGSNEKNTRLIPRFLTSTDQFHIQNDRFFDYISIQDICLIFKFIIENNVTLKDINCVYDEKIKISDFLSKFINVHKIKTSFVVSSTSNLNYTGNGENLKSLQIKLEGIDSGIKKYFD